MPNMSFRLFFYDSTKHKPFSFDFISLFICLEIERKTFIGDYMFVELTKMENLQSTFEVNDLRREKIEGS